MPHIPVFTSNSRPLTRVEALGGGAGIELELHTLTGRTLEQFNELPKNYLLLVLHVQPGSGAKEAQSRGFEESQPDPAVALDQSDADHTGLPASDFHHVFFYADPAKPFLNVYSVNGCSFILSLVGEGI